MPTPSTAIDVLIVGAGPTGLTMACDLARRGVAHRLIDQAEAFNTASRAKTIMPRSLEIADDLGFAADIVRTGRVDLPARYYDAEGRAADRPGIAVPAHVASPYPDPVWIAEFDVERAMRDRYAQLGGQVELASAATGLAQDPDGVTVTTETARGPRAVRARYVVGADGGKGRVRRLVGAPLLGTTFDRQRWYLGDVRLRGLDRERMHVWFSAAGMLGLTPLPGSDLWQLQATISPAAADPEPPSVELYQAMLAHHAGAEQVRLTSASWLSIYRVNVRMVERYRHDHVFLAGDAAHVHSPAGGQGMNTGIQDAYNLAWKLHAALAGAVPDLLDTYDAERRPVARAVLDDSTTKLGAVMTVVAGRGSSASTLGTISDDLTTGLLVAYPDSSLTLPTVGGVVDGPRPGDRAPHAAGVRGRRDRSPADLFRGPHWTLLAFTDDPLPRLPATDPGVLHVHPIASNGHRADGSSLVDEDGHAYRAYAARDGDLVLVRPDGYIATRQATAHLDVITQHLDGHLPRRHGVAAAEAVPSASTGS